MAILLKGKKGVGPVTIEGRAAVVGTRSTCDLVVDDPMVAERHLELTEEDGRWFVQDLGTSSGTYVDGIATEGATEIVGEGKITVVFGVSKFLCEIDGEKGLLTCTLKEQSFFYDKKEDPLRWSRYEVEFGRFRPVRVGNYVAVILVGLLFAASFIDAVEEPLVDPGPLARVHRPEYWEIHARDGLAQLAEAGHENGACEACHEGWSGTPPDSCGICHEAIVANPTHPPSWDGQSCQPCHVDHRGEDTASLTSVRAEETCAACHGDEIPEITAPKPVPAPTKEWVVLTYDTFPHDKHLTASARSNGIEGCGTCHEAAATPMPADPTQGRPRREFKRVTYERCQECHGSSEIEARVRWTTSWHGAEDDGGASCRQCHETLHQPELTQVQRLPRTGTEDGAHTYALTPRDHQHEFDTGGKACADCHRDGKISQATLSGRPFPHGLHLTSLDAASEGECRSCHTGVGSGPGAAALASGVYAGPPSDQSCSECHDKGVPVATVRPGLAEFVGVNQFPHGKHLDVSKPGLEQGCFSCHTVSSDVRSMAVPGTTAEARSCTPCHQNHDNVGGGDCDACHLPGDPVYSGERVFRSWPAPNTFSHRTRGHDGDCVACHKDGSGVEDKTRLRDVKLPTEADDSCRDCHVKQRARFHWK